MLGPERFLSDGQRSPMERFRLRILPLVATDLCEIVEAIRDIRMLGAERFFSDGQRSRQEQFRLRILPLVVVERCEVVEAGRDLRMLGPERFLIDDQRSPIERFRFRILPLVVVELSLGWPALAPRAVPPPRTEPSHSSNSPPDPTIGQLLENRGRTSQSTARALALAESIDRTTASWNTRHWEKLHSLREPLAPHTLASDHHSSRL